MEPNVTSNSLNVRSGEYSDEEQFEMLQALRLPEQETHVTDFVNHNEIVYQNNGREVLPGADSSEHEIEEASAESVDSLQLGACSLSTSSNADEEVSNTTELWHPMVTESDLQDETHFNNPRYSSNPVSVNFSQMKSYTCPGCAQEVQGSNSSSLQVRLVDAIHHNDVDTVKEILLAKQLEPNFEVQMRSPICRATAIGNIQIINLLLDAGANPNTPNFADLLWERRPVHIAASKGHLSALQLLVQRGADINQHDSDHRTPLHWVAMYGQAHMIKWMLKAGASVNVAQTDGFTPLHTASCLGHKEVCRLLIEGGANIARRDRDGWTPLHTAVCYGYLDIVELLIEKGADPLCTTSSNNDSTLHIACSKGNVQIIDLLLKMGVPIEGTNNFGSSPLHTAVYYNRLYAAYFLIKCGANVNTRNYTGSCPVYLSAIRCEMETLRLLIGAGCRITRGISLPVAQQSQTLANFMEDIASRPQPLTDLCLLTIRHTLAPNLQKNAKHLPLPSAAKRALVMTDLTFTVSDGLGGQMVVTSDCEEGQEENLVVTSNGLRFKLLKTGGKDSFTLGSTSDADEDNA